MDKTLEQELTEIRPKVLATALRFFRASRLDGDPEDVVVFGDDLNDLDMFAPGFFKIAMGNGHPDLKAVADQVAPSNVEDGIYRICQENGWF